ncbi:MAG: leucine-rich repeat protein [Clostridia bacterium]|nr:leucine-rich repeat protein [Clostridia bacterium]
MGAYIRVRLERQRFLFIWDEVLYRDYDAVGESYQNEFHYPVTDEGTYRCTVLYTVYGTGEDDVITFKDTRTYEGKGAETTADTVTTPTVSTAPTTSATVPQATYPPATVPQGTYPPATVPQATYPPATVPQGTYPPATVPTQSEPPVTPTVPTQTTPAPTQTRPTQTETTAPVTPSVPTVSEGLSFFAMESGRARLSALGTWNGTTLVLPSVYDGMPVTEIAADALRTGTMIRTILLPDTMLCIPAEEIKALPNLNYNVYEGLCYLGTAENPYYALICPVDPALRACVVHEDTEIVAEGAFYGCENLTEVLLPEGLKYLGKLAFYGCDALNFNEYLGGRYLGTPANPYFSMMKWDSTFGSECVLHPDTVRIENRALQTTLTKLTLNDGLRVIAEHAFYGADGGYGVTLPEGVRVDHLAFYHADVGHLEIPASAVLEPYAFANSFITSVAIGHGREELARGLFAECGMLIMAEIPESVRDIRDKAFYGCPLYTLKLPSAVRSIGAYAFSGCETTSLILPETLKTIGECAFYACPKLISVTIPQTVTTLSDRAFAGCHTLSAVTVGVSEIPYGLFLDCNRLSAVTLTASVRRIGAYAFADCDALATLTVPEGVTDIGMMAFSECKVLREVSLPMSLKRLDSGILLACHALERVTYPGSAEDFDAIVKANDTANEAFVYLIVYGQTGGEITPTPDDGAAERNPYFDYFTFEEKADGSGYIITDFDSSTLGRVELSIPVSYLGKPITAIAKGAFAHEAHLVSVTVPGNIIAINDEAFFNCEKLVKVTVEDGVMEIGCRAFMQTPVRSVVLGDTLEVIADSAFESCVSLTEIVMPQSMMFIGDSAFAGCTALTRVTLNGSLMNFGGSVFYGCNALDTVTWMGDAESFRALAAENLHWADGANGGETLTVSCRDASVLQSTDVMMQNGFVFEELESREGYAIRDFDPEACSQETVLTLPTTYNGKPVIGVRRRVFYNLQYTYTGIVIPEGYRYLDMGAVSGGYRYVTLPDSLSRISYQALAGVKIETLRVPASLTEIEARAFHNCTELHTVILHEGITKIGDGAFWNCINLSAIELPSTLTHIGRDAFRQCGALGTLTLPEGLVYVGADAFHGCMLREITLPSTLERIGDSAFASSRVRRVVLPSGLRALGDGAFENCTYLQELVLPATLRAVGDGAFRNTNLKTITYLGTVTRFHETYHGKFASGITVVCTDGNTVT